MAFDPLRTMSRRARSFSLVPLVAALAGTGHANGAWTPDPRHAWPARLRVQMPADSELFTVATRELSSEPGTLRVDPRPLRADSQVLDVHAGAFATVPAVVLQRRRETLRQLDIGEVDLRARHRCAGALVPDAGPEDRADCPATGSVLWAAVSLPWVVSEYHSEPGGTPVAECGVSACAVVRVIAIRLTPHGSATTTFDYVFQNSQRTGGWRLVRKEPLLFTH